MRIQDSVKIKSLADNRESYNSLIYYVELRINALKDSLLFIDDLNELKKVQGAIQELKRFYTLRDEVNNPRD